MHKKSEKYSIVVWFHRIISKFSGSSWKLVWKACVILRNSGTVVIWALFQYKDRLSRHTDCILMEILYLYGIFILKRSSVAPFTNMV